MECTVDSIKKIKKGEDGKTYRKDRLRSFARMTALDLSRYSFVAYMHVLSYSVFIALLDHCFASYMYSGTPLNGH